MEEILYVWIERKRYKLVSEDGEYWCLCNVRTRRRLYEPVAHRLNYWRRKGVLEGEEEKGS